MLPVYHSSGPTRLNDLVALKLSPALLDALEAGTLVFKADADHSYVCTSSETFRIMGSSCNPTVCLLEHHTEQLQLTQAVKSMLSVTKVPGSIDWSRVPEYGLGGLSSRRSLKSLVDSSFCSENEFRALWAARGGVEIEGNACVVSDDLVYKLAVEINGDLFGGRDVSTLDQNRQLPGELYTAIYSRLWPDPAKWVGLYLLKTSNQKSVDKFLSKWQRDMLGHDCQMPALQGHYIQRGDLLIPITSLPGDPKARLKLLFEKKPDWTLEELVPFIGDLTAADEAQSYIKRYARIVNTGDPQRRGKIIKKVVPLNF